MAKDKNRRAMRSPCPIAGTLDVVGDRWTLLVVRDLLWGKKRYNDLASSPEGIPTNILADRLKRLESAGLVKKTAYQMRPVRFEYRLTAKGEALRPVIRAISLWGEAHVPGTNKVADDF